MLREEISQTLRWREVDSNRLSRPAIATELRARCVPNGMWMPALATWLVPGLGRPANELHPAVIPSGAEQLDAGIEDAL
jgi:hypothetical protein